MSQAVLEETPERATGLGGRPGRYARPRTRAGRASRAWITLAACQREDPELFYNCQSPLERARAKAVCTDCLVTEECLAAVMEEEAAREGESPEVNKKNRFGIRAGLTASERWALAYPDLNSALDELQLFLLMLGGQQHGAKAGKWASCA